MVPLGNCWERLCDYIVFFFAWYREAPSTQWTLQYGLSFSINNQELVLHMGAMKLVDSNLNFYNKKSKPYSQIDCTHELHCTNTILFKSQQNGPKLRVASLDALLKRLILCNLCMTQNCSAYTNT